MSEAPRCQGVDGVPASASLSSGTLGPEAGQPACGCCGETQDRRPFLQALLGLEGLLEGLEEPARYWGFPGSSGSKEPTCNAGDIRDAGSIPGLGRSPGEGNGKALQYSYWEISWTDSLRATERACSTHARFLTTPAGSAPQGRHRQGHARPLAPAPPALPAQQTEAEGALRPPFTDEETEAQEVQGTQTL